MNKWTFKQLKLKLTIEIKLDSVDGFHILEVIRLRCFIIIIIVVIFLRLYMERVLV